MLADGFCLSLASGKSRDERFGGDMGASGKLLWTSTGTHVSAAGRLCVTDGAQVVFQNGPSNGERACGLLKLVTSLLVRAAVDGVVVLIVRWG